MGDEKQTLEYHAKPIVRYRIRAGFVWLCISAFIFMLLFWLALKCVVSALPKAP